MTLGVDSVLSEAERERIVNRRRVADTIAHLVRAPGTRAEYHDGLRVAVLDMWRELRHDEWLDIGGG